MDTAPIRFFPALLSVAAVILIEMPARQFSGNPYAVTGVARVFQIIAVLSIFYACNRNLLVFGFRSGFMRTGVFKGCVWSMGFAAAAGTGALGLYGAGMDPFELVKVRLPASAGSLALFYLVAGVVGPIAEEVVFRGVLYGYFRDLFYPVLKKGAIVTALVASTVLFVAAHSHLPALPVPQIAGGVIFCLAYEMEKNLVVPVIIHSLGNMALFTLSLV